MTTLLLREEFSMDENRALWNAVFAAEMVATFRHRAEHEGARHALDKLEHSVEDAECLADEIVLALQSYKLKKGK